MPNFDEVTVDLSDYLALCDKDLEQPEQHRYEVTRDAIRHFAYAIEDYNALYLDEEYARQTRWGGIIAPPGYLYSHGYLFHSWPRHLGKIVDSTGREMETSENAKEEWDFYIPARPGDVILSHSKPAAAEVKRGVRMGIMAIVHSDTRLVNQRGELVAKLRTSSFRFNSQRQQELGPLAQSYVGRPPAAVTRGHVQPHHPRRYDSQTVYFEDIEVGTKIPELTIGPLTSTHTQAFESHVADIHRPTGGEGNPMISSGIVPGLYAVGVLRVAWFGSMLNRWIGPNGFIRNLGHLNREWVLVGYKYVCSGEVIKKYVEDGRCLVQCELGVASEWGKVTNPGWATVELPSRG